MLGYDVLIDSLDLDAMLAEALELPINKWVKESRVSVKAYYQSELARDEYATIRAATDVERHLLEVDVIIVFSFTGTASYTHRDMMVALSDLLNMMQPIYGGRDDAPAVLIKQQGYRLNPAIVNFFGEDNKVTGDIFRKLDRKPYAQVYDDDEDALRGRYTRVENVPAGGQCAPAGRFARF